MKNYKGKKSERKVERTILAATIALVLAIGTISPNSIIFAYDGSSEIINATFSETKAENQMSATLHLNIVEKEDQEIQSIKLPDGSELAKDAFERNDKQEILVDYKADKNSEYEYTVFYSEKKKTSESADNAGSETVPATVLEEKLTHKVTDLKVIDDFKLSITANDITFASIDKVDVMSGIVIKNEDDKDITASQTISVVDYGKLFSGLAGTYPVKYETLYSNNEKTYSFSRNITITDSNEKKAKSRTAAPRTDDIGISLSTGNTGLTDPKDFVIGKSEQETFNITVFYNDSSAELDRKLKVYIPKGFVAEGRLDASSLDGASDIKYETLADGQTVITITFIDGRTVVTGFDINIKQDKKLLYDMADISDQVYLFQAEKLVGSSSKELKNFQIKTDKLKDSFQDDNVTIDPIDNVTVDYSKRRVTASNSDEPGTIVIKKKAFTDLSVNEFILPAKISIEEPLKEDFEYGSYDLFLGDKKIKSGKIPLNMMWYESYYSVYLNWLTEFEYAYEDITLKLYDVGFYFSVGTVFDSPETPYKTMNQFEMIDLGTRRKSFGYISVNPQLKEPNFLEYNAENKNPFFSGSPYKKFALRQGKRFENFTESSSVLEYYFIIDDKTNKFRKVESTFEFPYIVQPFSVNVYSDAFKAQYRSEKAEIELKTNKRTLVLKNADHPLGYTNFINFESDLQAGEYVSKITVRHNTGEATLVNFGYNVMKTSEDGSELAKVEYANVKETLSSPLAPNYKKSYTYDFLVVKEEINTMDLRSRKDIESMVGNSAKYMSYVDLDGKFNQALEKDLVLTYSGGKALSLAKSIFIRKQSWLGENASIQVEYNTNLRNNLVSTEISDGQNDFNLTDGEYVTTLQVKIKDLEGAQANSKDVAGFDDKSSYLGISLGTDEVPEKFPDGSKVSNISSLYKYTLSRPDGSILASAVGSDIFMGVLDYEFKISSTGREGGINSQPQYGVLSKPLFSVDAISYDRHNVKELKIDFDGTNKDLLSLIGSVKKKSGLGQPVLHYKTNLGRDIEVSCSYTWDRVELNLQHNEYITEMFLLYENFNGIDAIGDILPAFEFYRREDYPRSLPIDGALIPTRNNNEQDPWEIKAELDQDGKKEKLTGSSVVVFAESSVLIYNTSAIASVMSDFIPKYPGQKETITLPKLPVELAKSGNQAFFRNKEEYNYIRIENPVVYFIIDKNFSVNPNEINKQGQDIDIQFKDGIMANGDSVLTFKFKNFEKIYRSGDYKSNIISIMDNITISPMVKLDAKSTKTSALKGMYYDIEDSINNYDNDSIYSRLKKDDSRFAVVDELGDRSLYKMEVEAKDIDLLPLTEMGVAVIGQRGNAESAKSVVGYDHEVYKQKLSIISNLTQPTYDWELYVPVPKKGKTVKYTDTGGVVEGPKAEYSMYLDELVNLADFPAGSKIEYTTDADPLYSLDGTSVGNYTENPTNLKDVTMIHITIPKLDAKQKVYPTIKYKVDGEKKKTGKQVVLGGTYFNMKLGSASGSYYRDGGIFADRLDFSLKDFVISGKVWEDKAPRANSQFDDIDKGLKDVTVKAIDKNKVEYTAKTDQDGNYNLNIPSNGEVKLIVNKPNDLKTDPKQMYKVVQSSIDNYFDDKDDATGTASVTLSDSDFTNANAGLWAISAVSVVGKEVVVKKGDTVAVPAIAFPSDSAIIYGNATNDKIATVSSDGKVTGVKVGNTKAIVTVKDDIGIHGDAIAEYTIKVIPDHGPTVTTEDIETFVSAGYDPKANIVIKDGIDEVISVDDTSKVTIDDSKVDATKPGKYPIVYTVNDSYNVITYTRYVYLHGDVIIDPHPDKTLKIGSTLVPNSGASASLIRVNKDGTTTKAHVPVSSPLGSSLLLPNIEVVTIPLYAEANLGTIKSEANSTYRVNVHGETILDAVRPVVTVKVGGTLNNIKDAVQATASMETPSGIVNPVINWDNFKAFDTTKPSNTLTANITAVDPDTGATVSKEITIHISKTASITAPDSTDIVVGDQFDPTKNITITDGDGNTVVVTPGMIHKNDIPTSADGTATTPGNYEVEYKYTDDYGNEATAKTTVKVHGALQFDNTRVDRIQTPTGLDDGLNDKANLAKLAWFINSDGDKKPAIFVKGDFVHPSINGSSTQGITFKHPFKTGEQTFSRKIYTHGMVIVKAPTEKVVKVGVNVNKIDGATATYIHAYDLTNETKTIPVTSSAGATVTSMVPTVVEVPLYAAVEPAPGLFNTGTGKYKVVFNGYPEIHSAFDKIKVRVGATPEEIKALIRVQATVHYGKDALPTDITNLVNWDDLANVDTSMKKAEYTLTISVTDRDGAIVEKEIKILISDEIIMNLPNVDKVIGDSFYPFENVEIFDGNGNKVDSDDIIVDDSKVDMDNPGSYEVEYTYEDDFGNKKTETNTIRVNGKLQIEGLDRIDLIEKKDTTYLPDSGKAFYIDYNKKKVSVPGTYDHNIDQSIVKKNEVIFQATHPVNMEISSGKQYVYVHGDIEFHQKDKEMIGKVGATIDTKDGYTASYKHVNDDGTITKKDVPVTGKDVTSDKVGHVNSEVSAKVEIIDGLVNEKKQDVKVAFNGLPFIQSASSLYFDGETTKAEIIKLMEASAGMKKADGVVVDLTSAIDFSDIDNVTLNKSGKYTVTITVKDQDGFVTYKDIEITIAIPEPEKPINPGDNGNGNNGNNGNNTNDGNNGNNATDGNNGNNANDANNGNNANEDDKKDDVITVITKDIPLSKAENGITDDLIKSFITANSKNSGRMDFEIVSHTVKGKVGTYKATIRLADGSERTISIKVVDDALRDVQQPEFGRDSDCIIQWIMLLLLLGYSGFGITAILKRRQENAKLEKMLGKYSENLEGEVNKQ